jgi:RHS repeat-associated protein
VYQVLPNTNSFHHYYQFDPNGSTISMTSDGDFFLNRYAYDPFGKLTNSAEVFPNTDETFPNQFKFGGRFGLIDEDNGLIYVRARYYSPELGRFLTKDPLAGNLKNGQNLNSYIYALDNPVKMIDPDGNKPELAELFNQWSSNYLTRAVFGVIEESAKKRALKDLTKSASLALTPAKEIGRNWNNPNMDITEKLARGVFSLGRTAVGEIPVVAISPFCGPYALTCSVAIGSVVDTYAQRTFEKSFAARKQDLEPVGQWTYNTFWAKPENSKEYKTNEHVIVKVQHQQQQRAAASPPTKVPSSKIMPRGPAVKIQPRGPAAAPIMPRGPKPAPIMPRGPSK